MCRWIWKRQSGLSLHREPNGGQQRRRLLTVLMVLLCTPALASAQEPILAQPSSEMRQELGRMLDQTLPQLHIDPQRLPERFRQQAIERIYEYAILYRASVQAMFRRAAPFLPMIKRTFKQHDVSVHFAYIPLIESRFRVDAAHPRSGARGLWQLMPITARGYGLQVSSQVDERLDPLRATQAAARYLRRLQDRFGDNRPLSILAAYNYGGANLTRAMKRAQTRDIAHLYQHRQLPYQTREYLIRMVALWTVIAHASHFELVPERAPLPPAYPGGTPVPSLARVTMDDPAPLSSASAIRSGAPGCEARIYRSCRLVAGFMRSLKPLLASFNAALWKASSRGDIASHTPSERLPKEPVVPSES